MKTLTLFFLIVFTTLCSVNAQITEGNWMVGGDAHFTSNNLNGDTFTEIRINPNAGYFILDKLAGGLQLNLDFTNTTPDESNNTASFYGFAPYARYYFLNTHKRINIFTEASYSFRFGNYGRGNTINWNGYGIKAGTALFFNNSVGIEFSLNYTDTSRKADNYRVKTLIVGFGFQIHLEKK
ncbi:outer membrane beta-barrel protein [Algibacter sp. PT7-4]|uniref:outer membrane beta-barrel protein n=1 Tax=Algibacter ulvanivorans TaxID=3400999 RepID=UPI003AAB7F44